MPQLIKRTLFSSLLLCYLALTTVTARAEQIYIPAAGNNPYTGILFTDDFSDPESGWPIFEDAVFANSYVEDEYQLRVKTRNGASWAFPSGRILKEYSVEIDVRVVEQGDQSSYGFVYDLKDPNHFSTFTIDDNSRMFSVQRLETDGWQLLHDWQFTSAILPYPAQNRLRIERRGQEYVAFINNQEVTRGQTISQGNGLEVGVVLYAFDQNVPVAVRFDNYEVQHLVD